MKIFNAIESIKGILETGSCKVGAIFLNEEAPRNYYRPIYLNQEYRHDDITIGFDVFENIERPEILLLKVTFAS